MYNLKNGVLIKDDKPVFCLGQSYYPSFHPNKHPVPPEQDRDAEMKKDLRDMAEAGFNLVRLAAIGKYSRENGEVKVEMPLPDMLCREADAVGIAAMVRLHGYSFGLSDAAGTVMLNENNEEMPYYWGWFVRHCLNHPGVIKDEKDGTTAGARHFSRFPSVVGFQIYNEPAYPSKGLYDYHPASIAAFRQWLAETGRMSPALAEQAEPPRRYPERGEAPEPWIAWRLFHLQRLNDYLNMLSDEAKTVAPGIGTLTCNMPCPLQPGNSLRGVDYFRVAEKMDIVGITLYYGAGGAAYYYTSEIMALAESAAAVYGKHSWIVEYNAATRGTGDAWERDAYTAIGAGMKGIIYYQWRGDYPYPDTPEADRFGMIFSDRKKTPKYDRAIAMTRLINELSDYLVNAEKMRSGVAVLFSENVNARCNAVENTNPDGVEGNASMVHTERNVALMLKCFKDFSRSGVNVDFVTASHLKDNPLHVKLLLIPLKSGLSAMELSQIEAFKANGGFVAEHDPYPVDLGYLMDCGTEPEVSKDDPGYLSSIRVNSMEPEHVLARSGIAPLFSIDEPYLDVKLLQGEDYFVAVLVNHDGFGRKISHGKRLSLNLNCNIESVEFFTPVSRGPLDFTMDKKTCRIVLPEITTGAFIFIKKDSCEI